MTLTTDQRFNLSALLCSRICHDLISPIGAIGNGLELLSMGDAGAGNAEITLVADSVANANARIRLFRIAFGASGNNTQGIARDDIISILDDLKRGSRTHIHWEISKALVRREAKLALLAFMCLDSAMTHGGEITIEQRDGGHWHMHGKAPRLRIQTPLWDMAQGKGSPEEIAAGEVHFALFAQELGEQARSLTLSVIENDITLTF